VPCHLISTCTGYFQYHQVLPPEDLSKMDLLREFWLEFYVLGLDLTLTTTGSAFRAYGMEHPSVQIWHSVLWGRDVHKQNLSLTSKFLFEFYILGSLIKVNCSRNNLPSL
jgi:hypothetical protein